MRKWTYIALLLLASCSESQTEFKTAEEFHAYLNNPNNGFIQEQESSEFVYEAKLVPAIKDDPKPHFTVQLRISRKDGGSVLDSQGASIDQRADREGYLSFGVIEDVYIKMGKKTLNPVFHHYERNYGLKPSVDVLFEFAHKVPEQDVFFCYRDELFGQGLIELEFDKELFTTCYVTQK